MKLKRLGDVVVNELHNGDVECIAVERGVYVGKSFLPGVPGERRPSEGAPRDGHKIIIPKQFRAELAALLAEDSGIDFKAELDKRLNLRSIDRSWREEVGE